MVSPAQRENLKSDLRAARCPKCGWRDVRFSHLRGLHEWILRKLSVPAFRCRSCGHRFYRYHRALPQ